jgi:predicted transcriptional regulator
MSKKSKKKYRNTSKIANKTAGAKSSKNYEFDPDYSDVVKDLKRIGILAGTFFALLIVLSFIL